MSSAGCCLGVTFPGGHPRASLQPYERYMMLYLTGLHGYSQSAERKFGQINAAM